MGKGSTHKRLTTKEIRHEVLSQFNIERGLIYTFLALLKKPAQLVDTYVFKSRENIFNPFRYLLFGAAASTFAMLHHAGFKSFMEAQSQNSSQQFQELEEQFGLPFSEAMSTAQQIYLSYQNLFFLVVIPFISFLTYWMFQKKRYNYAENMAINAFLFGTTSWLTGIYSLFTFWIKAKEVTYISMGLTLFVAVYLYTKIYGVSYLKGFLGFGLVYFIVIALGSVFQVGAMIILLFTL